MRRRALTAALTVLITGAAFAVGLEPAAGAAEQKTSVAELEDELMCPVCGTLLGLADAPQAQRQRAMIERLAGRGYSKDEIKQVMVDEFGPGVLATPEGSGFGLVAYLVPIAGFLLGGGALAVAMLRWRRRGAVDVDDTAEANERHLDAEERRPGTARDRWDP